MKNLFQKFEKDHLNEIVFANRNKAYGAYVLRSEYSGQLTKALFIGVAFFASLSMIPLVISAFETKTIITDFVPTGPYVLDDVDTPDIIKPATSNVAPDVKTVAYPEFTLVRKIEKDKPIPTKKDFEGAAIGDETKGGVETNIPFVPSAVPGPPTVNYIPTVLPAQPVEDPNKILDPTGVDVSANFKGGINAFRQRVSQNFDTESMDQSGMVSGVITFVVEKDGSISNIKTTGNNSDFNREAERTVKAIKSKWTPAQLNGKAVRSFFRMPISMRIE